MNFLGYIYQGHEKETSGYFTLTTLELDQGS